MFNVGDVGVNHECDKVKDEVGTLAQDGEGREAEVFKSRVVDGLYATHSVNHFLAYLDRRSERFGISSKDVPKVDYKAMSLAERM